MASDGVGCGAGDASVQCRVIGPTPGSVGKKRQLDQADGAGSNQPSEVTMTPSKRMNLSEGAARSVEPHAAASTARACSPATQESGVAHMHVASYTQPCTAGNGATMPRRPPSRMNTPSARKSLLLALQHGGSGELPRPCALQLPSMGENQQPTAAAAAATTQQAGAAAAVAAGDLSHAARQQAASRKPRLASARAAAAAGGPTTLAGLAGTSSSAAAPPPPIAPRFPAALMRAAPPAALPTPAPAVAMPVSAAPPAAASTQPTLPPSPPPCQPPATPAAPFPPAPPAPLAGSGDGGDSVGAAGSSGRLDERSPGFTQVLVRLLQRQLLTDGPQGASPDVHALQHLSLLSSPPRVGGPAQLSAEGQQVQQQQQPELPPGVEQQQHQLELPPEEQLEQLVQQQQHQPDLLPEEQLEQQQQRQGGSVHGEQHQVSSLRSPAAPLSPHSTMICGEDSDVDDAASSGSPGPGNGTAPTADNSPGPWAGAAPTVDSGPRPGAGTPTTAGGSPQGGERLSLRADAQPTTQSPATAQAQSGPQQSNGSAGATQGCSTSLGASDAAVAPPAPAAQQPPTATDMPVRVSAPAAFLSGATLPDPASPAAPCGMPLAATSAASPASPAAASPAAPAAPAAISPAAPAATSPGPSSPADSTATAAKPAQGNAVVGAGLPSPRPAPASSPALSRAFLPENIIDLTQEEGEEEEGKGREGGAEANSSLGSPANPQQQAGPRLQPPLGQQGPPRSPPAPQHLSPVPQRTPGAGTSTGGGRPQPASGSAAEPAVGASAPHPSGSGTLPSGRRTPRSAARAGCPVVDLTGGPVRVVVDMTSSEGEAPLVVDLTGPSDQVMMGPGNQVMTGRGSGSAQQIMANTSIDQVMMVVDLAEDAALPVAAAMVEAAATTAAGAAAGATATGEVPAAAGGAVAATVPKCTAATAAVVQLPGAVPSPTGAAAEPKDGSPVHADVEMEVAQDQDMVSPVPASGIVVPSQREPSAALRQGAWAPATAATAANDVPNSPAPTGQAPMDSPSTIGRAPASSSPPAAGQAAASSPHAAGQAASSNPGGPVSGTTVGNSTSPPPPLASLGAPATSGTPGAVGNPGTLVASGTPGGLATASTTLGTPGPLGTPGAVGNPAAPGALASSATLGTPGNTGAPGPRVPSGTPGPLATASATLGLLRAALRARRSPGASTSSLGSEPSSLWSSPSPDPSPAGARTAPASDPSPVGARATPTSTMRGDTQQPAGPNPALGDGASGPASEDVQQLPFTALGDGVVGVVEASGGDGVGDGMQPDPMLVMEGSVTAGVMDGVGSTTCQVVEGTAAAAAGPHPSPPRPEPQQTDEEDMPLAGGNDLPAADLADGPVAQPSDAPKPSGPALPAAALPAPVTATASLCRLSQLLSFGGEATTAASQHDDGPLTVPPPSASLFDDSPASQPASSATGRLPPPPFGSLPAVTATGCSQSGGPAFRHPLGAWAAPPPPPRGAVPHPLDRWATAGALPARGGAAGHHGPQPPADNPVFSTPTHSRPLRVFESSPLTSASPTHATAPPLGGARPLPPPWPQTHGQAAQQPAGRAGPQSQLPAPAQGALGGLPHQAPAPPPTDPFTSTSHLPPWVTGPSDSGSTIQRAWNTLGASPSWSGPLDMGLPTLGHGPGPLGMGLGGGGPPGLGLGAASGGVGGGACHAGGPLSDDPAFLMDVLWDLDGPGGSLLHHPDLPAWEVDESSLMDWAAVVHGVGSDSPFVRCSGSGSAGGEAAAGTGPGLATRWGAAETAAAVTPAGDPLVAAAGQSAGSGLERDAAGLLPTVAAPVAWPSPGGPGGGAVGSNGVSKPPGEQKPVRAASPSGGGGVWSAGPDGHRPLRAASPNRSSPAPPLPLQRGGSTGLSQSLLNFPPLGAGALGSASKAAGGTPTEGVTGGLFQGSFRNKGRAALLLAAASSPLRSTPAPHNRSGGTGSQPGETSPLTGGLSQQSPYPNAVGMPPRTSQGTPYPHLTIRRAPDTPQGPAGTASAHAPMPTADVLTSPVDSAAMDPNSCAAEPAAAAAAAAAFPAAAAAAAFPAAAAVAAASAGATQSAACGMVVATAGAGSCVASEVVGGSVGTASAAAYGSAGMATAGEGSGSISPEPLGASGPLGVAAGGVAGVGSGSGLQQGSGAGSIRLTEISPPSDSLAGGGGGKIHQVSPSVVGGMRFSPPMGRHTARKHQFMQRLNGSHHSNKGTLGQGLNTSQSPSPTPCQPGSATNQPNRPQSHGPRDGSVEEEDGEEVQGPWAPSVSPPQQQDGQGQGVQGVSMSGGGGGGGGGRIQAMSRGAPDGGRTSPMLPPWPRLGGAQGAGRTTRQPSPSSGNSSGHGRTTISPLPGSASARPTFRGNHLTSGSPAGSTARAKRLVMQGSPAYKGGSSSGSPGTMQGRGGLCGQRTPGTSMHGMPGAEEVGPVEDEGGVLHVPRTTLGQRVTKAHLSIVRPLGLCDLEQRARDAHHNHRLAEAWFTRQERWARMDMAGQEVSTCSLVVHKARAVSCMNHFEDKYGMDLSRSLKTRLAVEWSQLQRVRAAACERAALTARAQRVARLALASPPAARPLVLEFARELQELEPGVEGEEDEEEEEEGGSVGQAEAGQRADVGETVVAAAQAGDAMVVEAVGVVEAVERQGCGGVVGGEEKVGATSGRDGVVGRGGERGAVGGERVCLAPAECDETGMDWEASGGGCGGGGQENSCPNLQPLCAGEPPAGDGAPSAVRSAGPVAPNTAQAEPDVGAGQAAGLGRPTPLSILRQHTRARQYQATKSVQFAQQLEIGQQAGYRAQRH